MSTVTPQPRQRGEEEEEDEEEGEKFEFEDSTDEEKVQGDSKELGSSSSVKAMETISMETLSIKAASQTQETAQQTSRSDLLSVSTAPSIRQEVHLPEAKNPTACTGEVCHVDQLG